MSKKRWEYKMVKVVPTQLDTLMHNPPEEILHPDIVNLGIDGWELVSVVSLGVTDEREFYFKR